MKPRSMTRRATVAVLAATTALILTSCSTSDDGTTDDDGGATSTATSSETLDAPTDVPTEGDPEGSPTAELTEPEPAGEPNLGATEPVARETKEPVAVEKPADFGTGVTAKIAGTKGVQMTNVLPGEIAGPAVAVTVEYTNTSGEEKALQDIVTLNYDGMEASGFEGEPAKPAPDKLAPGQSATAVYVFGVPEDKRGNATIRVSYTPEAPQVVFTGPIG